MVPRHHCTATVWSHVVTVQVRYGPTSSLLIGANQPRKMYSKWAHPTVAVQWTGGTVLWLYANTDNHILPIWPVEADSIVVKTLRKVSCFFKMQKWKWPTRQLKIVYWLIPLLTPVSCRWTVPLTQNSKFAAEERGKNYTVKIEQCINGATKMLYILGWCLGTYISWVAYVTALAYRAYYMGHGGQWRWPWNIIKETASSNWTSV